MSGNLRRRSAHFSRIARASAVLLTVAAGLLLGYSIAARHRTGNAPARVVWGDCNRDFGRIAQGPVLEARFAVRNRGGKRLVLNLRHCECSSEPAPTIIIPTGESSTVTAKLDTRTCNGRVTHRVQYATNDPVSPTLTFTLRAEVF